MFTSGYYDEHKKATYSRYILKLTSKGKKTIPKNYDNKKI